MRAGRGYSFSVDVNEAVQCPLYLPAVRVACTPYGGGMRVGGTMEFRSADSPLDEKRVLMLERRVDTAAKRCRLGQPSRHLGWATSSDSGWLACCGPTRVPGAYVAGGHGMWGVTLGPVTGRLLALCIATGGLPDALGAFNALR